LAILTLIVGATDLSQRAASATAAATVASTGLAIALDHAFGLTKLHVCTGLTTRAETAAAPTTIIAAMFAETVGLAAAGNAAELLLVGVPAAHQTQVGGALFGVDLGVEAPFQGVALATAASGNVATSVAGRNALEAAITHLTGGALAANAPASVPTASFAYAAWRALLNTLIYVVALEAGQALPA
jgi:hypothetical protein